jgi:uncharacterized protein YjbJ (UPF0337 family)
MTDEELRGKGENLLGRGKQAAGAVAGNRRLESQGLFQRVRGALRERLGRLGRHRQQPQGT